ncbi:hypothetical protein NM208_g5041 [Fusarium decemcellulare]|uniref:Uncharacterized protein n=1 Tax=Fusarium decemcellulare TaxID=57161 RepID=A0ACC1SIL2_9HYPO|nr:hypothetical protein NM208_g5041 [Fusarium decemcellulare]
MDPLSILGVAAATVQFVDFGQRLFSETWQIYRSASGQTLQLENLSAVSADISRLSTTVKKAFQGQDKGVSALEDSSKELLRLCRECDDIATKIVAVISKVSKAFQDEIAEDKKAVQRAVERPWLGKYEPRSVGECFRTALRTWWEREEIAEISGRLEKVRQGMMMAATISIWRNSQSTRGWEHQFSNKLDTMIEMLSKSLATTGHSGPEQNQMHRQKTVEQTVAESMRQNSVTDQITSRMWKADWEPDPEVLASFPHKTELSAEELNSAICESLRFDTMDNREEAITKTFDCTFRWVFDKTPQISMEGTPMWSSLPDWLEGESGLPYWITGKPGSGKSTMMKFILQHPALNQHLRTWSQGSPLRVIKYYAWRPGAEMARSEDGLLRTLLHQILEIDPGMTPYLCPRRWSLFQTVRVIDAFPPWTIQELEESFERLLQLRENGPRLALFIDGLDEFDSAPVHLCKRIQAISSHRTVKICVASRPWPQFNDAFATSPGLQMHLLTDADIQVFVRGHFRGVVAFQELDDLYGGGGEELLADIVKKAKGVFLWTALVTQTLLENLIDGSGLPRLQEILDTMPSEIESLYDAIYEVIPKRLLPEVSVMLQLYVVAFQPVDCMTLWLADEARGKPTATQTRIQGLDMEKIHATLKRRLGARTRGILELVPRTRTVEYLHRTAAEWLNQEPVWKKILSESPPGFDPHACLLQIETLQAQNPDKSEPSFIPGSPRFWNGVTKALHYASQVDGTIIPDAALTAVLDQFHDASAKTFATFIAVNDLDAEEKICWASYQKMNSRYMTANTFNGMATQFAILPYIRQKLNGDPVIFHPAPPKRSIALLEQAINGPRAYSAAETLTLLDQPHVPTVSSAQRLQVLELLLQRGVKQPGLLRVMKDKRSYVQNREQAEYLDAVIKLLRRYRAASGEKRGFMRRLFGLV